MGIVNSQQRHDSPKLTAPLLPYETPRWPPSVPPHPLYWIQKTGPAVGAPYPDAFEVGIGEEEFVSRITGEAAARLHGLLSLQNNGARLPDTTTTKDFSGYIVYGNQAENKRNGDTKKRGTDSVVMAVQTIVLPCEVLFMQDRTIVEKAVLVGTYRGTEPVVASIREGTIFMDTLRNMAAILANDVPDADKRKLRYAGIRSKSFQHIKQTCKEKLSQAIFW